MKKLQKAAASFLKYNVALGYKMEHHSLYLRDFICFMEKKRASFITNELALQWAMLPQDVTPHTWAFRLRTIRHFAKYQSLEDKRTEIPSEKLLSNRYVRRHPYIYSQAEIGRLLSAARLPERPFWGVESYTLYSMLGLAACTGLRRAELLKLNDEDVDLKNGILSIKLTKFNKSRFVPIHRSVIVQMREYRQLRNAQTNLKTDAFFVTKRGQRISKSTINFAFIFASRQAGLRSITDSTGPRLHDLRHSFAVNTLIQWLHDDIDVDSELPALSTYLGHTDPQNTYWYFSCVPELMKLTQKKMHKLGRSFL